MNSDTMIFAKLFFRKVRNQKLKLLIILILYILIAVSIDAYPDNIVVDNSLSYQIDDVYGISIDVNTDKSEIQFKDLGEISVFKVSKYIILQGNNQISGLAKLEFADRGVNIAINEIYANNLNKTLVLGGIQFNITDVSVFNGINYAYSAIISLPEAYKSNFTDLYVGVDIYSEFDDEDLLYKAVDKFKLITSQYYDGNFVWVDLYQDNIEQLSESAERLQLQIFVVALFLFISLLATLIFIQISIQDEFNQPYQTLTLRGMQNEELSRYFVSYFLAINLMISVIVVIIVNYLISSDINTSIIVVFISIITSISTSLFRNNHIEDNDIFEYNNSPSIVEITLLILSVISFLVNIFINIPSLKIVKYILILTIYLSSGLLVSFILLKLSNTINKKRTRKFGLLSLFLNIDLRIDKKRIIRRIVIGIMLMSIISHQYAVSNINQIDNIDNPYGDIWASYYGDIPDEFDLSTGEYSISYPTVVNFQIKILQGIVLVDNSLMKIHNQFTDSKAGEFPELWVRDNVELSKYINYLSVVSIGENISFTEILKVSRTFDKLVQLPGNPDFILFLDSAYVSDYSETVFFIFRAINTIAELQSDVDKQLDTSINWIVPNKISILDFSIYQFNQKSRWTDPLFTLIFAIAVVFILGFIDTRIVFNREFSIIKIKGILKRDLNRIGISIFGVGTISRTIINIAGLVLISTLIDLFQLVSNVPDLNMVEIIFYGSIYAIIFILGQISSWIIKSR